MTVSYADSQLPARYAVPTEELGLFSKLPPECATEVLARLSAMEFISGAKSVRKGAADVAAANVGTPGWSAVRLCTLHKAWVESHGDWKVLVNKSKAGASWWDKVDDVGLPKAFLEHWGKLIEENQRGKMRAAYRRLLVQWKQWRRGHSASAIPGYATCPPDGGCGHPRGWSYKNLTRSWHVPTKAERVLVQRGSAAARSYLPGIPSTRAGARPFEFVFFDDVWLDRKVIVPGVREPRRLLQLGCIDWATGVYLKFGQRPEMPATDPDGARERLQEAEMRLLVATLLTDYGYPLDYPMHLIVERGTATIRDGEAEALHQLSGGRIRVCRTSMEGSLVLSWKEAAKGNPRGKAALESWHNLFHNYNAHFAGQVGKDRDHQPAALPGAERYAIAMQEAGALLSPEQRAQIWMPFAGIQQAYRETEEVIHAINHRTDHDLEDFDKVTLWRMRGTDMEWRPATEAVALPAEVQAHLEFRTVQESPMQRFKRLSAGVRMGRIPANILPRLLEDQHVVTKISGQVVSFSKEGRRYSYVAPSPEEARALEGQTVLAYFNPRSPGRIILTQQGTGRVVGEWLQQTRIQRGDQKALADEMARRQGYLAEATQQVRRRHGDTIQANLDAVRRNEVVLQSAGLLPHNEAPTRPTDHLPESARGIAVHMEAETMAAHDARQRKAEIDEAMQAAEVMDIAEAMVPMDEEMDFTEAGGDSDGFLDSLM